MAREIWKIDKFDGGLNNHKDPKDLKANEFPELVDVNVSIEGSIKALGCTIPSDDVRETVVEEIFPGEGLHTYYSDYTMNPNLTSDVGFATKITQHGTSGTGAAMTFSLSSLYWLFESASSDVLTCPDKPIEGKLMVRLGVWRPNDGDDNYTFVPIHGNDTSLSGTSSNTDPLVVLSDDTNWGTLAGSAVGGGTSVNLFNTPTYYKYTDETTLGIPSSSGGNIYYPEIYPYLYPNVDDLWYVNDGKNRVAGLYWSQLSGSSHQTQWLVNNNPNTSTPYYQAVNSEIGGNYFPTYHWDYTYDYGDDTNPQSLLEGTIWDNRMIFGSPIPGKESAKAIGYSYSKAFSNTSENQLLTTVFSMGSGYLDYNYNSDFDLEKSIVQFPSVNKSIYQNTNLNGLDIDNIYGWATWNSIAHWLIRAINRYTEDSTGYGDFAAKFTHYDYYKNEFLTELGKNDKVYYTDRMDDTITLTANDKGTHLNGLNLAIELTSNSVNNAAGSAVTQINNTVGGLTWHALYNDDTAGISGAYRGRIEQAVVDTQEFIIVSNETARYLRANEIIKVTSTDGTTKVEYMLVKGMTDYFPDNSKNIIQVQRGMKGHFDRGTTKTAQSFSEGDRIHKLEIHPLAYDSSSNYLQLNGLPLDNQGGYARDWGVGAYIHGERAFSGGDNTASGTHQVRLYITGSQNTGDYVHVELYNSYYGTGAGDAPLGISIEANGNHTVTLNAIKAGLDAANGVSCSSVGTETDAASPNYGDEYIDVTSATAGVAGIFALHYSVMPADVMLESTLTDAQEEYTLLLEKSTSLAYAGPADSVSFLNSFNAANPSQLMMGTWRKVGVRMHSKLANNWMSTSYLQNQSGSRLESKIDWFYNSGSDATDFVPKPLFWSDDSKLRLLDTNFKLDNTPRKIGFYDIRNWFSNLNNGESTGGGLPLKYLHNATTEWNILTEAQTGGLTYWGYDITKLERDWKYSKNTDSNWGTGGLLNGLDTGSASGVDNPDEDVYDYVTLNPSAVYSKAVFEMQTTGGVDWTGTCHFYASAVFEDGTETLPVHKFSSEIDFTPAEGEEMDNYLRFYFAVKPFSDTAYILRNIDAIGYHIYYTSSEENFDTYWSLGQVLFNKGFVPANVVGSSDLVSDSGIMGFGIYDDMSTNKGVFSIFDGIRNYYDFKSMPKLKTYEMVNQGVSPYSVTLNAKYKAQCIAGRRNFVGNIAIKETPNSDNYTYYNDAMIVSPPNGLDILPYPGGRISVDTSDGDEIIAMSGQGDKVFQFKKKILYIINISSGLPAEYYTEKKLRYKGISNKNHMIDTENGVFWFNEFGAYIYDGNDVKDVTFKEGEEDSSTRRLDIDTWKNFVSDSSLAGYDASSRECFVIKSHTHASVTDGDCYVYNIHLDTWSYGYGKFYTGGDSSTNTHMTNVIVLGDEFKLGFIRDKSFGDEAGGEES